MLIGVHTNKCPLLGYGEFQGTTAANIVKTKAITFCSILKLLQQTHKRTSAILFNKQKIASQIRKSPTWCTSLCRKDSRELGKGKWHFYGEG